MAEQITITKDELINNKDYSTINGFYKHQKYWIKYRLWATINQIVNNAIIILN